MEYIISNIVPNMSLILLKLRLKLNTDATSWLIRLYLAMHLFLDIDSIGIPCLE